MSSEHATWPRPRSIPGAPALLTDRLLAVGIVLVVAAAAGAATAVIAPRGPTTVANALIVMLVALGVGTVGGSLAPTRWILDGAAEPAGRRDPALEWFAGLAAPSKQLATYPDAAHAVAFEQADAVQQLFTETIVPATYRH